ncbi:MAG: hypothetical protein NVS2B11_15400 [Acetobacteraceae bacterium]
MISSTYDLTARLVANGASIRDQLSTLQEQAASGRVADTYAGLGSTSSRISLDMRPVLTHQQTWQTNIDAAQARLGVTQNSLKAISSIASDFYARINSLSDIGGSQAVTNIAAAAKSALQQVGDLLNSKSGDIYVFAGQDTANPPLPSTNPTVLSTALLASDTATAPFSTTIGTARPTVEIGEGQRLPVGLLANQNTMATSAAPTTGSYMRDLMRTLSSLAGMTPGPGVSVVRTDAQARLSSVITALSDETGGLGDIQNTLTNRRTALDLMNTAVSKQLSSVEDVDVAAALTKASALQTQLQASYKIIADSRQLSLVSYL